MNKTDEFQIEGKLSPSDLLASATQFAVAYQREYPAHLAHEAFLDGLDAALTLARMIQSRSWKNQGAARVRTGTAESGGGQGHADEEGQAESLGIFDAADPEDYAIINNRSDHRC